MKTTLMTTSDHPNQTFTMSETNFLLESKALLHPKSLVVVVVFIVIVAIVVPYLKQSSSPSSLSASPNLPNVYFCFLRVSLSSLSSCLALSFGKQEMQIGELKIRKIMRKKSGEMFCE